MYDKKILVVEDEKPINDLIASYLSKEGFEICSALNGKQALELAEKENPDLVLLDVMLPDISGVDLCVSLRRSSNIPILFLSCKGEEIDKIVALSVGGDDYITKPFLPGELVARVKAHLRRFYSLNAAPSSEEVYEAEGLTLNLTTREVHVNGDLVNLTAKEFDILCLLMKNPRRIYSSMQIFENAWGMPGIVGDEKTIMVYISTLRKKLEGNNRDRKYIVNIRSIGYKFNHSLIINR